MCGITSYWAKEALLNKEEYDELLQGITLRGNDGLGIGILNTNGMYLYLEEKRVGSYFDNKEKFLKFIIDNIELGSILFAISRATPETENTTTVKMLQPIYNEEEKLILIHNGGVTESIRKEFGKYNYETEIDSEIIIASYLDSGRNMKSCMERLSGSFAFVLVDKKKDKMYSVTSFNPLAHMYIRGYGYFLHSDNSILENVLNRITGGVSSDGVNVWESWYHHYLEGFTIIETDLQSGFQFVQKYKPRFLHPIWDSTKELCNREKVLVACSGGIDSGLTTYILKKIGYDVEMVHFTHGQHSEQAELWAVKKQAENFSCPLHIIPLNDLYGKIGDSGSMLLNKEHGILSGGDMLKSTIAWTAGRNVIFSSIIMAMAEAKILRGECSKVYISAGWAQLSEECSGYVDNSFQFSRTLNDLKNYGYITGSQIEFLPVLQRLTKTEEWKLGFELGFTFEATVSCDNAKLYNNGIYTYPRLCVECGSTKLSILAADRAGVKDSRLFRKSRPILSSRVDVPGIDNLIKRLILPKEEDYSKLGLVCSSR